MKVSSPTLGLCEYPSINRYSLRKYHLSVLNTPFEVAATVMGCTPYYMPRRVDDLRYCTGDEATEFVKVINNPRLLDTVVPYATAYITYSLIEDLFF